MGYTHILYYSKQYLKQVQESNRAAGVSSIKLLFRAFKPEGVEDMDLRDNMPAGKLLMAASTV